MNSKNESKYTYELDRMFKEKELIEKSLEEAEERGYDNLAKTLRHELQDIDNRISKLEDRLKYDYVARPEKYILLPNIQVYINKDAYLKEISDLSDSELMEYAKEETKRIFIAAGNMKSYYKDDGYDKYVSSLYDSLLKLKNNNGNIEESFSYNYIDESSLTRSMRFPTIEDLPDYNEELEAELNNRIVDLRYFDYSHVFVILADLYNRSALTFEGFDEESILEVLEYLEQSVSGEEKYEAPQAFIFSGSQLNEICKLDGPNAYPEDLNIVSFLYTGNALAINIGARWLDDIIDNNADKTGYHPFKGDKLDDEEDYNEEVFDYNDNYDNF